jgi:tRNA(Ile)-lysidine synthase
VFPFSFPFPPVFSPLMLLRLLEQLEFTNRRQRLLKKGDALVVGVSGGADSVALLELLSKLRRKYALRLSVAHLNHGLQKEGRRAQTLACEAAERHGVPFYSKKANIRRLALKDKLSLEDAGRRERYRFFEAVARKTRSNKIATAHTLDDQAETMLMRLLRGSGIRGLRGIPYKRKQGTLEIVRPVLDCPKKDLRLLLKKEHLFFVHDKMNDDPIFLRNRIRHQLLPLLKRRFNPQIKSTMANLQSICHETQDYLEHQVKGVFQRCHVSSGPHKIVLNVSRLKVLHPALRHEILASCIQKLRGGLTGFGYAHWIAADTILSSGEKDLQSHWPYQVRIRKMGNRLVISDSSI